MQLLWRQFSQGNVFHFGLSYVFHEPALDSFAAVNVGQNACTRTPRGLVASLEPHAALSGIVSTPR